MWYVANTALICAYLWDLKLEYVEKQENVYLVLLGGGVFSYKNLLHPRHLSGGIWQVHLSFFCYRSSCIVLYPTGSETVSVCTGSGTTQELHSIQMLSPFVSRTLGRKHEEAVPWDLSSVIHERGCRSAECQVPSNQRVVCSLTHLCVFVIGRLPCKHGPRAESIPTQP